MRSKHLVITANATAYGHCFSERVEADVCYRRTAQVSQEASYNVFQWDWAVDWLVAARQQPSSEDSP
jgi:hypothetical protein